jgi:hypothetical protein
MRQRFVSHYQQIFLDIPENFTKEIKIKKNNGNNNCTEILIQIEARDALT